jgi:cytidylate kinase
LRERARRRWLELRSKGTDADLATVEDDMRQRDAKDAARVTAPLRPADDAYQIDTTAMDAEEAFRAALAFIRTQIDVGSAGAPGSGCGAE